MIGKALISELMNKNISVDKSKTSERLGELWRSCDSKMKKEIIDYGSTNDSSMYRFIRLGNVSAKVVVAMAEMCNVNPLYLTGNTDERTECTDELIIEFLNGCGYGNLIKELTKSTKSKKTANAKEKKANKAEKPEAVVQSEPITQAETQDESVTNIPPETWIAPPKEDIITETANETKMDKPFPIPQVDEEIPSDDVEAVDDVSKKLDIVDSIIDLYSSHANELAADQINTINTLTTEDIDLLLKGLVVKARAGGKNTAISDIIKLLLIN